jgi:hypothetical protein
VKVVYSSSNLALVAHYRVLLQGLGVPCRLRNEFLAGAAGELPPVECWPQLCVDDRDEVRAREALAALQAAPAGEPWTCPDCGERLEGQFTECWRCTEGPGGA